MQSLDGHCKSFDESANGYVRSETNCTVLLQKAKDAKRIYSEVVHAKRNCDGFKQEGITFPSFQDQKQLYVDFYDECGVNPLDLQFIEAHGTGKQLYTQENNIL